MHNGSNVLNKFPNSVAPTVKSDLRDIWQRRTLAEDGEADGLYTRRAASKKWHRLNGANQLPRVVDDIKFTDGIALSDAENRAADQAASPKSGHSSVLRSCSLRLDTFGTVSARRGCVMHGSARNGSLAAGRPQDSARILALCLAAKLAA